MTLDCVELIIKLTIVGIIPRSGIKKLKRINILLFRRALIYVDVSNE